MSNLTRHLFRLPRDLWAIIWSCDKASVSPGPCNFINQSTAWIFSFCFNFFLGFDWVTRGTSPPPHPHISRLKSYWILLGNFIKENSLRLEIWLLLRTDTTGDICKFPNRQSLAHWLSLLPSNIIFKKKILIILSLDRWQHVSEHLLSLQSRRAYAFNFRSHSLLKITDTFMLKYST